MNEQWRDVIGYEDYYQVSNLGRVRSVDRVVPHKQGYGTRKRKGRMLAPCSRDTCGHLAVGLWRKGSGRMIFVHQLVAAAWIGPCPNGQQVRHGPNGVTDNSVSNLCYGTRRDDSLDKRRDGTHGGKAVRRSDGVEFINMRVAAEESNCKVSGIWRVCNRKRKTTGGYGWEYI